MIAVDTFVWLTHPDTGGVARFPAESAEAWCARGWQPCEAPPEDLSYLRDPEPLEPEPASSPDEQSTTGEASAPLRKAKRSES